MPTRRVTVHSIELHRYEECVAYCEASVSTGTYIRAIARDLGSLLGSAAHARNIRRTQIERVSVEDAVSLDDLSTDHLVPPRDLLPLAEVVLDDDELARIQKGLPIEARDSAVEEFVALIHSDALIGVAETTDVGLQPRVVFPTDN